MPKANLKTKSPQLKAKLTWLPKKTFELEFTIPWEQVKKAYRQALKKLAQEAKVKGFRKGKAPLDVVEKEVDQGKVYGEVINQLLPLAYAQAIAQHRLKPAMPPKIQIIKAQLNQDWQFKASACELPEIKLGDYQQTVKGALAKDKLWKPGDPVKEDKKEASPTAKLNRIVNALLKTVTIELSDLLVESEQKRMLAKLLEEAQKLGLTIEQYASANNKTVAQLRQEYHQTALQTLKMELILQAIADDRQIKVKKEAIDKMINSSQDEKIKQKLNTPAERAYIASVLRKRKVIDYLLSL
jgi:FKBP-type peptidyl-prolyl cis-trans isomerase (trigger factor)